MQKQIEDLVKENQQLKERLHQFQCNFKESRMALM
jgi:FtsZ-binding cell division protein ZapB